MNRAKISTVFVAAITASLMTACSSKTPTDAASSSTTVTSAPSAGASRGTVAPVPTGTVRPNPRGLSFSASSVNRNDPAATGTAFLKILNTQDTAIDLSPYSAAARAADLATPSYAAQLRQPLSAAPGAVWTQLASKKGYTRTDVRIIPSDDPPPSSSTDAYITAEVTVTYQGISTPAVKSSVFVHLTRANSRASWQVASSSANYE